MKIREVIEKDPAHEVVQDILKLAEAFRRNPNDTLTSGSVAKTLERIVKQRYGEWTDI